MKKTGIIVLAFLLCMLSACKFSLSDNKADKKAQETVEETSAAEEQTETDQENAKPDRPGAGSESADAADHALVGEWIVALWTSYSGKPDDSITQMESSTYMAEDDFMESTISVYEDNGALYADFSIAQYESNRTGYHLPVEIVNEPLYPECDNQEWYANIVNPKDKSALMKVTLVGENKLIDYDEYTADDVEDPWKSITIDTYLREGSEDYANRDELKYNNTVTVSNVNDLFKAIDKNTKIILEEGVYDFNDLDRNTEGTKYAEVSSDLDGNRVIKLTDLSYFALVAKEGAKVEICVETPYDPVLGFSYCSNVVLDGITFGHHVEPGTCGGSVLYVDSGATFDINNCHLYGCGAYGLEANSSSSINLTDTEIYECTYGITSLSNTYGVTFKNCSMHDNKEYDMIWASGSGNVAFEGCTFTKNAAGNAYNSDFVNIMDDCYDFAFRNCTFKDNSYTKFCAQEVTLENCTFDDKVLGESE